MPSRASGSEFYLPEINFHWPQTYFLFFISGYQITTKIQVNCYILSLYYQLCDNHICLRVLFSKKNRQGTGGRVISSPLSCHASKMMLALIVTRICFLKDDVPLKNELLLSAGDRNLRQTLQNIVGDSSTTSLSTTQGSSFSQDA